MKDLRVAVIGLGEAGRLHFETWTRQPGVQVVAVCDLKAEQAIRVAGPAIPHFHDAEELLEEVKLDAISLCTPTSSHHPIGELALSQGVSVLCEMPSTPNFRLTEEMIRAAHPTGARFQLASQFRNLGEVRLAKDLMDEGAIGEIMHFQIELSRQADMSSHWLAQPAISGGGALIDQGSHAFDLVRFLFGGIKQVESSRLRPVQKLKVEDQAMTFVTAGRNVRGQIVTSWSMRPASDFFLTAHGAKGTLALGWKASFVKRNGEDPVHIFNECAMDAAYRRMMSEFRDYVQRKADPWMTEEDTMALSGTVDAAYRSLTSGRAVTVETFERKTAAA
ncbi:MAG: Gfo/Idh/MocA family oxidoreductase [Bryobacterales bacterium]|nr:Gfo/Idh/MocA family oxidoreductase [Bryobacterales bacterium]